MNMHSATMQPRISTTRIIPVNGSAWRGRAPVRILAEPRKVTWIRVLNWAGWIAMLAIPLGILVWSGQETPEQKELRAEVQAIRMEGLVR